MEHSYVNRIELDCPKCQNQFFAGLWQIVDHVERPDLLEHIRAGQLNNIQCTTCNFAGQADTPLLIFRQQNVIPTLFSPAQRICRAENQEQAKISARRLKESIRADWQADWLKESLPGKWDRCRIRQTGRAASWPAQHA